MKANTTFQIIDEKGQVEEGVGEGVDREVYTLFWNEFSNSFTIGERERVPFVRHDHFIQEWESVARILVKGYTTTNYYPMYLSKAFIEYCLYDDVPDIVVLESFLKYLAVAKPIEVHFVKVEGLASRPIAHTCGPVLELPSTYSNFVELREQFNNILDQKSWGFDIM